MKTIPLTKGYVALVNEEDYERVSRFNWHAFIDRKKDGTIRNVYAYRNVPRSASSPRTGQMMHRFILDITDPKIDTDHRNRNGLDNQRNNLRACTRPQNSCNRSKQKDNKSGFKGVSWNRFHGKWHAQITVNGKVLSLGYFSSAIEAAKVYTSAAQKYHGEFARTE